MKDFQIQQLWRIMIDHIWLFYVIVAILLISHVGIHLSISNQLLSDMAGP